MYLETQQQPHQDFFLLNEYDDEAPTAAAAEAHPPRMTSMMLHFCTTRKIVSPLDESRPVGVVVLVPLLLCREHHELQRTFRAN